MQTSKKICKLAKTIKKFNQKNIGDKKHKLIAKELKLNINYHIKTGKKPEPSSSLVMHNKAQNNNPCKKNLNN